MKKLKLRLLMLFVLMSVASYAQQDQQFSHYMFNSLDYNPGYAGVEKLMRLNFISRVQYLLYEPKGNPQSNIISASTPIKDHKIGAGATLLYETLGPIRNLNFDVSVSKHFEVNNGLLGLGLNGGIIHQRLDGDPYEVIHQEDPIYNYLKSQNNSVLRPDLNAGIWYEHQKYYTGVSFNHITRSRFSYGSSFINSQLANHMYVTAGYRWKPAYTLDVTPSFIVQTDLNQVTYVFGGLVEYNKKIWAGLNVRQSLAKREQSQGGKKISNDDIILYVGINLLKNKHNQDALRIGYSFDFVTSGLRAKKRTSHELLVSYMIPNIFGSPKPPVRTPRYRHEN